MSKLSSIEYIKKCNLKHENKYDYSKTLYTGTKNKVIIICNEIDENNNIHGEFEMRADMHVFGKGCQKCNTQTLSTTEFIKRAILKHGTNYDYSKSKYVSSKSNIKIICNKSDKYGYHGEFEQIAANHLFGAGCPKCSNNEKLSINDFIHKSNITHNNKYDYSKVNIIDFNKSYVDIICNIHGIFNQRADIHIFGQGCPECGGTKKLTTEEFKNRAIKVHGNKYSYHKIEYIDINTNVWIHCEEIDENGLSHGDFSQTPHNHLNGKGCPKCAIQNTCSTTEEFILNSTKIHGNKYDYSLVDYKHSKELVKIICKKHGEFEQIPNGHLTGNGCNKCANEQTSSKAELEICDFISKNINIIANDRSVLNGLELDIYIPEKKLAIEFNGLYWHSELKKEKNYHSNKTQLCESKDIQLIHIFEDEWIEKEYIVKSRLSNILGLNQTKIYGRKCIIDSVSTTEVKEFLFNNHIQGYVASSINYGLYYDNELVSLMTFGGLRKNLGQESKENEYELLRFCNKLNTSVIGGASKLFKHFLKKHNPEKVISYADRRWSKGNLYEVLGFTFKHNSVPNYFYIFGQTRKNRFNFRKDILISKYGCLVEDTERNFCFNQGWYRIYDCGAKVYEYNNLK